MCGIPVDTLHPATSTRYSLHRVDGGIRPIVTDHAVFTLTDPPPGLDPGDGTLTVSPDGHTVTFTDSHHHTVTFTEHPGGFDLCAG